GLPFVNVATGWPGQGLEVACGVAYTGKYFDQARHSVFWVIGSLWKALAFASYYSLDDVMAIFDVNCIGHGGSMSIEHCIAVYQKCCEAFGHNVETLCHVYSQTAQVRGKPTAVVAKTFKARGMPRCIKLVWKANATDAIIKLIESQTQTNRILEPPPPIEDSPQINIMKKKACGLALAKLGHENDSVIVLDGDTKNSNLSAMFKKEHTERCIQCYIAEQNMMNVTLGWVTCDWIIAFVCTFAAFFTQAFDQIHMAATSQINIKPYWFPLSVIYTTQETFQIGQAKVVHNSDNDKISLSVSLTCLPLTLLTLPPSFPMQKPHLAELSPWRNTTQKSNIIVHQLAVMGVPRNGRSSEALEFSGINAIHINVAVK
ncbi:hypothetical protein U0070_006898, partial [Myodes glareolus]